MRLAFLLSIFLCIPQAFSSDKVDLSDRYSENQKAQEFAQYMINTYAFDQQFMDGILAEATRKDSIISAMNRPAEKVKPWYEYREIFLKDQRIDGGKAFLIKHKAIFDRMEETYGVPRAIVAAIIGVETYYGRIMGSYRVVDALSTLAFDYPSRSTFFTKELENYLLMSREQSFHPFDKKGSYAGAMGLGQFMPSSFRAYAVDFDGNGQIDLWDSPADAIGSVANYFVRHGWKEGQPVTTKAQLSKTFDDSIANDTLKPQHTVGSLRQHGFSVNNADDKTAATLTKLEGKEGYEYWVGYNNFYVITRYNHSRMYAMAVWQLAQSF